jgi:hypothetical protein
MSKADWEWRLELEGNPIFTKLRLELDAARERETRVREALEKLGRAHAEVCPSKQHCATLIACLAALAEPAS